MRVGVSGDVGSFSEDAGLIYINKLKAQKNILAQNNNSSINVLDSGISSLTNQTNFGIEDFEIKYLINMHGVLQALSRGDIDIGIFPVHNVNSGLVEESLVAMGKYLFEVIDQVALDIVQCLIVNKFINDLQQINKVYSYPVAFTQCKKFLDHNLPHASLIEWGDTALAARDLAGGVLDANCGVIASSRVAEIFSLNVLALGIQNSDPNITTFVVVKRI